MSRYWVPGLGRYLVRHPGDAPCVVRAGWRLRRDRWWRHFPWLPLPAAEYWEFRVRTVTGGHGRLEPSQVVAAAQWSDLQRVGR